jgi:hypothetical protein
MNEPVTIVTRAYTGTLDDYGNETATETTVETLGYLQQLSGTEREGYVPEVTDLLIVPPDTLIQANDAVMIGTVEYEVYGPPANVWNPRTAVFHHIEATLKRVVGHEAAA